MTPHWPLIACACNGKQPVLEWDQYFDWQSAVGLVGGTLDGVENVVLRLCRPFMVRRV